MIKPLKGLPSEANKELMRFFLCGKTGPARYQTQISISQVIKTMIDW